jgi:hypothetical protein
MRQFTMLLVGALLHVSAPESQAQDYGSMYSNNDEYKQRKVYVDAPVVGLHSLNSFPVFVEHGEHRAKAPVQGDTPRPVLVHSQVGQCAFTVTTTNYALNTHSLSPSRQFHQTEDSVIPHSLVKTGEDLGAALVNVSTSLDVLIRPDNRANCIKTLGQGRKVYVGSYSMAQAKLSFAKAQKTRGQYAPRVTRTKEVRLYLRYEPKKQQFLLLDEEDFTPLVNSAIFALQPKQSGIYGIQFHPRAKIHFAQPQISQQDNQRKIFAH